MIELRDYQKKGIEELKKALQYNNRVLFQLATGGGKTFIFSFFCKNWLQENEGNIIVLVHRKELLNQTINSFQKIGVEAKEISPETKGLGEGRVFVAMVQTLARRFAKNSDYVSATLVIVDECHRNDFGNVLQNFASSKVVGFSATPISASVKNPLKDFYTEIVACADISDLIETGSLSKNLTYTFKNGVDRKNLRKNSFGEFSNNSLLEQFGNPKLIFNTVNAYEKHCKNGKTIIFNVNVEHSKMVADAFTEKGYDCRHLDGESSDRLEILEWFRNTENAILCNIDILTTGFDEPTIKNVIVNRSTKSLPLWLQMTGRGGRLAAGKDHFKIIDLGENVPTFGDWSEKRNWKKLFFEPKIYKEGVAPVKICEDCGYINHTRAEFCGDCGVEFPKKVVAEVKMPELVLISKIAKNIDVEVLAFKNKDYKPARTVHKLQEEIVKAFHKIDVNLFLKQKEKLINEVQFEFWDKYKMLSSQKPDVYKKSHYNKSFWFEQLNDKIKTYYGI